MSCCGKKREALNFSDANALLQYEGINEEITNPKNVGFLQTDAVFRYRGNQSLRVKGISNQRVYNFSANTPELLVLAEDTAMMRGYPDLIEIKPA